MPTTDVQAPAVPRGWPPEQPVEIVKISRRLLCFAALALLFNAAAMCWLAQEIRASREEASERGARIIDALTPKKEPK